MPYLMAPIDLPTIIFTNVSSPTIIDLAAVCLLALVRSLDILCTAKSEFHDSYSVRSSILDDKKKTRNRALGP
jgi:hypothetical protein